MTEPVGQGKNGDVWLGDIWPSNAEVQALMSKAMDPAVFRSNYAQIKSDPGALWEKIAGVQGEVYNWPTSTYVAEPPSFEGFGMQPAAMPVGTGAHVLSGCGASVPTDTTSPAGYRTDE